MKRRPPSLAPAWAKLAGVALTRAEGEAASSETSRLLKLEVRRRRGRLHLLWLMQPEDHDLVDRLRTMGRALAAESVEACEVCGRHVPRRGPRADVFCDEHDVPF